MALQDMLERESHLDNTLLANLAETSMEDMNEIDIIRHYYQRAYGSSFHRCHPRSPVHMAAKCVQTAPDTSGVSPAWILSGQSLVDELYTGMGNALNALYHAPIRKEDVHTMKGVGGSRSQRSTYLAYDDGYWRSKLMPEIKIAGVEDADRQVQILHSENFKNSLKKLMTIASKLRNLVYYLDENFDSTTERTSSNQVIFEDKSQQTENEPSINFKNTQPLDRTVPAVMVADACEQASREWTCRQCGLFQNTLISNECDMTSCTFQEAILDVNSTSATTNDLSNLANKFMINESYDDFEWIAAEFGKPEKIGTNKASRINEYFEMCMVKKTKEYGTGVQNLNMGKKGLYSIRERSRTCPTNNAGALINIKDHKGITTDYIMHGESSKHSSNHSDVKDGELYALKGNVTDDIPIQGKENLYHSNKVHFKQSKAGISGSSCKNFIKRNILATKVVPHRINTQGKHGEPGCSGSSDFQRRKGKVTHL